MNGRAIVDTNVLLYAEDTKSPEKRERARGLLARLVSAEKATLTAQVLGEFYSAATRKLHVTMTAESAAATAERLGWLMPVLPVTHEVVREAIRGSRRYGMAYFDAQIWAVARLAAIPVVLTEDTQCAPEIEGVRFIDPFAPGVTPEDVLAALE